MNLSIYIFLFAVVLMVIIIGCNELISTSAPPPDELLAEPIEGLSGSQLTTHLQGDEEFGRIFGAGDGLGPIFVHTSCENCHAGDGKGAQFIRLTRFGRTRIDGTFDPLRQFGGPQLQQRSLPGYPAEIIPDSATGITILMPPSVTGMGLLGTVPDVALLILSDSSDANGDGVSGVPNYVSPPDFFVSQIGIHIENNGKFIGRFGRKAAVITVLQQVAEAYVNDIGITSDFISEDLYNHSLGRGTGDHVGDPEVPSSIVRSVEFYIRTLKPPPRRNQDNPDVRAGETIFSNIRCTSCHVPALTTGPSDIEALSNKRFFPYTDLLLHDMGPELDDYYTEGSAQTSEWRTTPLWGLGLGTSSQGGKAFYLHDGRATTIEQAINFHGGEAFQSRTSFQSLSPSDKQKLLKFLESL